MATPRATEWIHGDGAFGPYFRLRCACCDCPTLRAGVGEDTYWPQACGLCEWENTGPVGSDAGVERGELALAKARFRRFNWMYDPGKLPLWLTTVPSKDELERRKELRELYAAIDDEPDGARFLELWETACALEDMLTDMAKRRVSGELEAAETALADSADVSPTALADLSDDDVDELDDPDDLREGCERDSDPP